MNVPAGETAQALRNADSAKLEAARPRALPRLKVSVLTGGGDMHYAIPLSLSLARQHLCVDVIGSTQFLASR